MEHRYEIQKLIGYSCFACGTENPIGLNMQFFREEKKICSEITLKRYYEGWENIAHGGIVSTMLDEIMSWAIMYFKKIFIMTRTMEIKYIRPVLVNVPLKVCGTIVDDSNPPRVNATGEIRDMEGRLLVRAKGEFVILDDDKLLHVPDRLKRDMRILFRSFER
jgi:acyl-CoA thioesterase FadM